MAYREVLNDIKKNEIKDVYLFHGEEVFLIDFCVNKIKNKYIDSSFETLNYIQMEGRDLSASKVSNACETLPFMADKKVVVVNDPSFFSKQSRAEDVEEISKYLDKPSKSTILVFVIKSEKVDGRKKTTKKIKKQKGLIEFKKIKGNELERWIKKEFDIKNKEIDKKDINQFIESTGYLNRDSSATLYDLKNEIQKIINYIGDSKKVKSKDIEKVIIKSLEDDIFKLVKALGEMRINESISIFNEMILNNQPPGLILHMISRQFNLLLMGKILQSKGYGPSELAKKMRIKSYFVRDILNQSRNFTTKELQDNLNECIRTDRYIKQGRVSPVLGIEMLIMSMRKDN